MFAVQSALFFVVVFQLCWQLFVVDVEIKLGVFFDGVQYNTGVGLPNVDIRQQLLDLRVHAVCIFEFADCDDVVVACRLVHTDHLVFGTESVDDVRLYTERVTVESATSRAMTDRLMSTV